MDKTYTAYVQYDPKTDEYVIPLPYEMCSEQGWDVGTVFQWEMKDGGILLTKKKEPKYQLVEAVSTFRMRYVVQTDSPTWASDTVVCNEATEFSQEHLGETIVSVRELTKEEVLEQCDVDNSYVKNWTDEQKLKNFVTYIDKDTE